MGTARRHLREIFEEYIAVAPRVAECLEEGFEDTMAVLALPPALSQVPKEH